MARKKVKKKKKPLKFKTITLKITARQKRSLSNYCKSRRTTPNKLIKKAMKPFLQNYADLEVNVSAVKVNQLALFEQE
jgi:hypothetical protein